MNKKVSYRLPDGKARYINQDSLSLIAAGFMGKLVGEDQRLFEAMLRSVELPSEIA